MRLASRIAALLALAAAAPAYATGTIQCRSTISPDAGPELWLVVGTNGVTQARLVQGGESFTTGEGANAPVIGQTWLDRYMLKVDISDANAETLIARLDTRRRRGFDYLGTLVLRGRTWRVRCSEEG